MTLPALPDLGSTEWYDWAAGVHTEAERVDGIGGVASDAAAAAADALAAIPGGADARIAAAAGVSIASLVDGKVPSSQMPPFAFGERFTVASQAAMLALPAVRGDVAVRTDLDPDGWFILTSDSPGTLVDWVQIAVTPPEIGDIPGLQAALDALAVVTANTQTASYTLALGDAVCKVVEMNVPSANTLTVPPNSSVAFPVGTAIEVNQYGAGQTTITAGAGVTLRPVGGKLRTAGQYATAGLRKRATNEWVVSGELST